MDAGVGVNVVVVMDAHMEVKTSADMDVGMDVDAWESTRRRSVGRPAGRKKQKKNNN